MGMGMGGCSTDSQTDKTKRKEKSEENRTIKPEIQENDTERINRTGLNATGLTLPWHDTKRRARGRGMGGHRSLQTLKLEKMTKELIEPNRAEPSARGGQTNKIEIGPLGI
jgi:hypothetical protein